MASITLRPISGSGSNWSNIGNAYDGNESTNASVSVSLFNSPRTLTLNFDTTVIPSEATINSATLTLRSKAGKTTITAHVEINGNSEYRVISRKQSTKATNYTADVADYMSDLQNVVVTVDNSNWSGNTFDLHELWIDVDYTIPPTYTVRFLDWDNIVIDTQTIISGGSATPPPDPTRDGYRFTGWQGTYTNVTADTDITAQYIKTYSITVNTNSDHMGMVNNNSSTTFIDVVDEGSSKTYNITPNNGYVVSNVSVDKVGQGSVTSYTFENITSNHNLSVTFEALPTYNIKYKLIQCSVSDNTITTVQGGSSFNTTITPVDGHTIEELKVKILMAGTDITNSVVSRASNNYTVSIPNVSGNIEIIAYVGTLVTIAQGAVDSSVGDGSFMGSDHDLYFKSIRTDYIDISRYSSITMYVNDPAGFVTYNRYNSTKSYVNATDLDPIVGLYTYNTISDDNYIIFDIVHENVYNYSDLRDAPEISVEDYICSYEFVSKVVYHTITVTHNEGGTADCDPTIEVEDGSSITITFTPNEGYRLSDVKVDNVSQGAIATYTFDNVTYDHTIQAVFEQIPTYTITASSNVGGSISPNGETVVLENGSQSYTISANRGYGIKDVLVDGVSQGAISSYTFANVNSNHTIEVVFEPAPTVVAAIENNVFYAINLFEGYNNFSIGPDGVYLNAIHEDLNENENIYLDSNCILHVFKFIDGDL